jgi:ABC-type polysaccharide/polyol phosphate export permease
MSDLPRIHISGRSGLGADLREASADFVGAARRWRLWTSLATHDITSRYRGSLLGPFWITATTACMIGGVGLMYSQLLHLSLAQYIPWLATGIVFWGFFSQVITEGCDSFISSGMIIKQTAIPMTSFIARMVARNLINFAHQLLIIIAVIVFFGLWRVANPLLSLAGFVLVMVNLTWIALASGIISARFRDVPQIVTAVVQVAVFITPVFWRPESITSHRFVLNGNPFYHMLEVTRRPLLGEPVALHSYVLLIGMALVGWLFTFILFARTRRRVVHYL